MAYKRPSDIGPESSRWRILHRELLSVCGIPDEVADSDRRWGYVLLHGNDALGTKWDPSWITPEQANRLLAVLERDLSSASAYWLLKSLRQRAAE